jgi:hypothetical protein
LIIWDYHGALHKLTSVLIFLFDQCILMAQKNFVFHTWVCYTLIRLTSLLLCPFKAQCFGNSEWSIWIDYFYYPLGWYFNENVSVMFLCALIWKSTFFLFHFSDLHICNTNFFLDICSKNLISIRDPCTSYETQTDKTCDHSLLTLTNR